MFSTRALASALLGVFLTAALVVAPYRFSPSKGLLAQTAAAQGDSDGSESGSGDETDSSGGSSAGSGDSGTTSEGTGAESGEAGTAAEDAGAASEANGTTDPDVTDEAGESLPNDASPDAGDAGRATVDTDEDGQESPQGEMEGTSTEPTESKDTDEVEPEQQAPQSETTADVPTEEANIEVQYANGMREEIRNGRYEMTDAQGRVIINRPATETDHTRLRAVGK